MNEFVEECRREWKRLHVPDPIANEMAADLEADLKEAEAEGASPEEVLGSGAFDPRSFASSWAAERGVAQPPLAPLVAPSTAHPRPRRRVGTLLAAVGGSVLVGLVVLVSAALAFGRIRTSQAIAAPVIRRVVIPPFPRMRVGPLFVHSASSGAPIVAIGLLVLLVGIIGLILTVLVWRRPWDHTGRWLRRRYDRDQTPQDQFS